MLGSAFLALGSSVPPPVSLHDGKHVSCNQQKLRAVEPAVSHKVADKCAVPAPPALTMTINSVYCNVPYMFVNWLKSVLPPVCSS